MDKKGLKEEALRSMKEFELAWQEFFKGKPEPKTDEEDRKQQEEFHYWYNYVRKQGDTGKTPAEMYKEVYGKEPPKNSQNPQDPSRMMNFEWDEDYEEDDFDDEQELKEITKIADTVFESGVWHNSKEKVKDMSRRESSKHMFRLGFFMHSRYIQEQMKDIADEIKNMSEEDIEKIAKDYKEEKEDE